jgi:hypothetical protein
MTQEKKESSMKLPITFKEFAKEPTKAIMFLCILAIGYLYIDSRMNYTRQIEQQGLKIEKLEMKIDELTQQLRRADSTLSAATSKIQTLQEMGKIK